MSLSTGGELLQTANSYPVRTPSSSTTTITPSSGRAWSRRPDRDGGPTPERYHGDAEKSARVFLDIDGKRYSVPGDYVRVRDDGAIDLLGRGASCINSGGEKIYPEEVEEVLKEHAAVVDACCVGLPDERFGQVVCALVEPAARLFAVGGRAHRLCQGPHRALKAPAVSCSSRHSSDSRTASSTALVSARWRRRDWSRRRPEPRQRPCQRGGRFSAKARGPSWKSSLAWITSHSWSAGARIRASSLWVVASSTRRRGADCERSVGSDRVGEAAGLGEARHRAERRGSRARARRRVRRRTAQR